jgi:hypothetical protein
MKTFMKIGFLALAITFSGKLTAQENVQTNKNLSYYYDTELFQWDYSIFGGLTLNFQNQSSITTFGLKESMKNVLIKYEDTNQQYRSYRGKTVAGNILMWGGLAVVLAGAYTPIFSFSDNQDNNAYVNNLKIGLGIMLGGLVSEIIGVFVLESGQENIFNAVNLYNKHRINDYK